MENRVINLTNRGQGVLFYTGYIRFDESREISFYLMTSIKYIDEFNIKLKKYDNFGAVPSMERLRPVIPSRDRI